MHPAPQPSLWSLLARAAELFPAYPALVEPGRRATYAEVHAEAQRLAGFLGARGVARGERVAYLGVNSGAFLTSTFAVAGAGAVLVPLNHRLAPPEVAAILADAGARWLLADADQAPAVTAAAAAGATLDAVIWTNAAGRGDGGATARALAGPPGVTTLTWAEATAEGAAAAPSPPDAPGGGDELAQLYYTSGTTGTPKGVMLTHRNVWSHALGAIAELGLGPTDVWGHIAPMFHLADAWATLAITWVGGCHVMVPRFSPEAVLEAMAREKITVTNLIPTMLNLVARHPGAGSYDLSAMRLLLSGGAPIAPTLVAELGALFGGEYVQTYGMTETSPYLTLSVLKPHLRRGSPEEQLRVRAKTGRPFCTVELRIVDEAGAQVPRDGRAVGEIQVRGESVTPGYWRRPAETAAAFTADGWLRTGDLAVWDAEAYVDIVDRRKDLIITGGENVYSTEVEHVLARHEAVLEAAVIGVPDDRWGEAVLAAVVLRPGRQARPEALIAFCRAHLAGFKTPKRVELLDALPRTGSGKIRKQALRERFGQAPS